MMLKVLLIIVPLHWRKIQIPVESRAEQTFLLRRVYQATFEHRNNNFHRRQTFRVEKIFSSTVFLILFTEEELKKVEREAYCCFHENSRASLFLRLEVSTFCKMIEICEMKISLNGFATEQAKQATPANSRNREIFPS